MAFWSFHLFLFLNGKYGIRSDSWVTDHLHSSCCSRGRRAGKLGGLCQHLGSLLVGVGVLGWFYLAPPDFPIVLHGMMFLCHCSENQSVGRLWAPRIRMPEVRHGLGQGTVYLCHLRRLWGVVGR